MADEQGRRPAAWRFVRAVVRAQRHGVAGAVFSGLLWQTGAVAAPLVVKYAIDHGIVPRDHSALLTWLIVLLAVGLLEVCAGAFRHLYAIRNRSHSDAGVRDALFAHALRLDASYHDRVGPGELLSRASSDSQHIARMMDAIGHTIGYALTVVAVAVVMLTLDAQLALVVLIPVPLISVGAWLYSRKYERGTRELQESWAQASTLVVRALALQQLRLRDWWRVAVRELPAGLTLGVILGVIGLVRIELWQLLHDHSIHILGVPLGMNYNQHPGISIEAHLVALTVGLALIGVVTFGTMVGSMLPFLFRRIGFDPASASAPFVATLVDVTGLVIYFTVALVVLHGVVL